MDIEGSGASLTNLKLERNFLMIWGSNDRDVRGDSFNELIIDTLEGRLDRERRDRHGLSSTELDHCCSQIISDRQQAVGGNVFLDEFLAF